MWSKWKVTTSGRNSGKYYAEFNNALRCCPNKNLVAYGPNIRPEDDTVYPAMP
jgi:hypothetical protein